MKSISSDCGFILKGLSKYMYFFEYVHSIVLEKLETWLFICKHIVIIFKGTLSRKIDPHEVKIYLKWELFYFYNFFQSPPWGGQRSKQAFIWVLAGEA